MASDVVGLLYCRTPAVSSILIPLMRQLILSSLLIGACSSLSAQTIDDGIMMSRQSIQAGAVYTRDSWSEYWEGTLRRVNGNIGTITTQTTTSMATYGLTDRVMIVGSVPYVRTSPSQGVLQGQHGVQDVMLGGKFSLVEISPAGHGVIRAIAAISGTVPLTDYTADFAPLSIGNQSRKLSTRFTANYQTGAGFYVNASTSYALRSNVTLDRPYYFTENRIFFTDDVEMPDVSDYAVGVGFLKYDLNANVSFARQTTRGGGDIRRQDMPFISNQMNFDKVGAMAMYPVPRMKAVAFYLSVAHTLDGRNVGKANAFAAGLLYSHASRGRLIR
jgi:hypothetical protein